jgi:hypothetical protein
MHGVRSVNRIIFLLFFCVSSTISFGMNDDTKQTTRRSSIGDYTEYLLNCLAAETWWKEHPHNKKHKKSNFYQHDERLRRKSDSSTCNPKNKRIIGIRKDSDPSDEK